LGSEAKNQVFRKICIVVVVRNFKDQTISEEVDMSRLIILALLVSVFVAYDFNSTVMAAPQAEDSSILIKCSTCGVEFTSMSAAKQHMKDHPDHEVAAAANPLIKCSTCGVEFTAQAGLKKHLQENPDHKGATLIQCSTCGVEFTSPGLWKEHLKKHPDHKTL
jgi:DNA-directed RNA polymerase subunit RPC12/RpoP